MIQMFIWAAAVYTRVVTLFNSLFNISSTRGFVASFPGAILHDILAVNLFVRLVSLLGVLAAIFLQFLKMRLAVLFLVFFVILWFCFDVFSGVTVVAFFAITVYAIWPATVFVKLRYSQYFFALGASFGVHAFDYTTTS